MAAEGKGEPADAEACGEHRAKGDGEAISPIANVAAGEGQDEQDHGAVI